MKKRFALATILFCLVFAMAVPAGATSQVVQKTETITTVYGDFEVEETLTVYSDLRSSTKSASKTTTTKYSGKVISEVTLNATFGYDGQTSWVVSASGSHTTYDGWTYSGEKITKSGGTASLTATLSKTGYKSMTVSISITCTASGSIS